MLFRLERNPDFNGQSSEGSEFGHQWIEVLAVEPWRLVQDKLQPEIRTVQNRYICQLDGTIARIQADALWTAIANGEYSLEDEVKRRTKES